MTTCKYSTITDACTRKPEYLLTDRHSLHSACDSLKNTFTNIMIISNKVKYSKREASNHNIRNESLLRIRSYALMKTSAFKTLLNSQGFDKTTLKSLWITSACLMCDGSGGFSSKRLRDSQYIFIQPHEVPHTMKLLGLHKQFGDLPHSGMFRPIWVMKVRESLLILHSFPSTVPV